MTWPPSTNAFTRLLFLGAAAFVVLAANSSVRERRVLAALPLTAAMDDAPVVVGIPAESLAAAVGDITGGNLFSPERAAPEEEQQNQPEPAPASPQPTPPKPSLVLHGIVGGPPWNAILSGVPGLERSIVVRQGDSVGGIRIRLVRADTVIACGLDTTWTLTLRR